MVPHTSVVGLRGLDVDAVIWGSPYAPDATYPGNDYPTSIGAASESGGTTSPSARLGVAISLLL